MSAAITAAVIVAGATVKSGMDAKKAQEKGIEHAKSEAERKRMYEEARIEAVRASPAGKAAAYLQKVGVEQVYDKAFKHFGIDINAAEISQAMGLDRIIENQKLGLPWDSGSAEREAQKEEQRNARIETKRYFDSKNAFDEGVAVAQEQAAAVPIQPLESSYADGLSGQYAKKYIAGDEGDSVEEDGNGESGAPFYSVASSMLGDRSA